MTGPDRDTEALNALALAGSLLATAEVLAVGRRAGLDPATLVHVLNESSGGSHASRHPIPEEVLTGRYAMGLPLADAAARVADLVSRARAAGAITPMVARIEELLRVAQARAPADADVTRATALVFAPEPGRAPLAEAAAAAPADLSPVARVGFVGLGAMGGKMVARLVAKGIAPVVFDVDAAAVRACVDQGARAAGSPGAVAGACDLVLLSLPDAAVVEAVAFGGEGIVAAATPGLIVADTSSSKADTSRKVGAALAAKGAHMLDAPVSRGQPAAIAGTLSIMVGGDAATLARCRPVLDLLGTDIIHTGPLGTGHVAKGLNNLVNATNVMIAGDTLIVAAKLGLEPRRVLDALNAGIGASEVLAKRYPQYVFPRSFDSNFRIGLMHKDAAYGLELAGQTRTPAVLAATALQLYALALAEMGPDADNTRAVTLLEGWNGVTLS